MTAPAPLDPSPIKGPYISTPDTVENGMLAGREVSRTWCGYPRERARAYVIGISALLGFAFLGIGFGVRKHNFVVGIIFLALGTIAGGIFMGLGMTVQAENARRFWNSTS